MIHILDIPDELKEDIFSRKCLLFIGAGFSLNAKLPPRKTMPDWSSLINSLKKSLKGKEEDKLKVASKYEQKFGRTKMIEKITSLLHADEAKPGKVHKKLAKIQEFDTIYTTNFDNLIEQAYSQENSFVQTIVGDEQIVFYSPRTHVNIIKMHGDLPRFEHLIITEKDYKNYLKKYPVIATHLSSMFATRTPLFLGYSLNDPHLNHITSILKKRLGKFKRKPYIVRFDASESEIKNLEKEEFFVINIESQGKTREQLLLDFLCEIFDYVNSKVMSMSLKESETIKDKPEGTIEKKFTKIRDEESYAGKIIRDSANLEVYLRSVLEKIGIDKQELKKPFLHLINHAFKIGILSSSDVQSIHRMREIRNEIAHSAKKISKNEVEYVQEISHSMISKLEEVKPNKIKIKIDLGLEKAVFVGDELIKIRGKVSSMIEKIPITMQIINPIGNITSLAQLQVKKNRFEANFKPGGPLWGHSGKYEIRVLYGNEKNSARVVFDYIREFNFEKQKNRYSFPVKTIDGKIEDVPYLLRGGVLTEALLDNELPSLVLRINVFSKGELWIKIPRQVLNAKQDGKNVNFIVIGNGEELEYTEKFDENIRELIIPLKRGTEEIEIIGTPFETLRIKKKGDSVIILKGSSVPRDDEKYLKPQTLIVKKGTTVTWSNSDSAAHTVTSGTPETGSDGNFDSSVFMSGTDFSHTFKRSGTYRYFCLAHPWKEGKIIVTE